MYIRQITIITITQILLYKREIQFEYTYNNYIPRVFIYRYSLLSLKVKLIILLYTRVCDKFGIFHRTPFLFCKNKKGKIV